MGTDAYLTSMGDIAVSPSGDIAMTQTPYRDHVQQVYVRLLTDIGDHLLYPKLGANLSQLYGMPQSHSTGAYGVQLINSALQREGRFTGLNTNVTAIPTGLQTLRFNVTLGVPTQENVIIQVQQNLGPS